jgi:iron complex transport system substrate-binding protein
LRSSLVGLAIAFALLATPAGAAIVTDASGRTITINDASRIVAIGGAVTEVLYALGLEDRVIAVDLTSTFPASAATKPSVGYMRTLAPEGVLSVAPSVVIAIEGSGPADAVDVLEKASVPFVLVPEAHDAAGVARKIRFIAEAIGERDKGEALAASVAQDLAAVSSATAKIVPRRTAVFVLSMAGGAPMVAGDKTAASDIFALAGIDNALTGFSGYRRASEEAALAAEPQAVVMMAERGHAMTADAVFSTPAFIGTPAARDRRLVSLPGSYLLGFGPRTAHAARDLAAAIYPDASLPALPARPWTDDGAR